MVRVQQPPGGETQLNNESEPEHLNVRVLKPPGGGSSISFGEDDDLSRFVKSNPAPQQKSSTPEEKTTPEQQQQQPSNNKEEVNGMVTPESPKENSTTTNTSSKENSPTAATNGIPSTNGSSTPSSVKVDTQNRLFGNDPPKDTPNRKVRDHQRSSIFSSEDGSSNAKLNGATNGTPRAMTCRAWTRRDPVTGVGVVCWDIHAPRWAPIKRKGITRKSANPVAVASETPEVKAPEQPQPQPQPQPQQKQRIPPGGFSSRLW